MADRLKAYTELTITDHDDLETEFERIRRSGYAECVEELERGMCSVAAPLAPTGQPPTMSIGATGSMRVFTPAFRVQTGENLLLLARDLSQRIGWPGAELQTS